MKIFIILTFLFAVGAMMGWCIEVVFRKFFSNANPEHRWINPGYCLGPWLPLYGFGLVGLYIIATLINVKIFEGIVFNRIILFIIMALAMTFIEFIAGEYCLRVLKVKLWDYSDCWGNIDTVICPLFTLFWGILGMIYFYSLHPIMEDLVIWLMNNQLYTFFIGMFYGIFLLDLIYSSNIIAKIKKAAIENNVVVEIENFKMELANVRKQYQTHSHYFLAYHSIKPISEVLAEYVGKRKEMISKIKNKK